MSQGKTLEQEAEEYADSLCPGYGARNQSWVRTRENFLAGAKAGEARGFRRGVEDAAKIVLHRVEHLRKGSADYPFENLLRGVLETRGEEIRSLLAEGGKGRE